MKKCRECKEEKPLSEFRRNVMLGGLISTCKTCQYAKTAASCSGGSSGYIDKDAPVTRDPVKAKKLMADAMMSMKERQVVEKAVAITAEYRTWYLDPERPSDTAWEGDTALDVVERLMPDAHPRRQGLVLSAAVALATERGVDMISKPKRARVA